MIIKTLSEGAACVGAAPESGKGGHGVAEHVLRSGRLWQALGRINQPPQL